MELLTTASEQGVCIASPTVKRLDASVALAFKEAMLKQAVSDGGTVLDLSNVQFMDSSGLGALVSVLKTTANRGGFAVCNVNNAVLSLFKLTRMDRVFPIAATPAEAIQRLRG